MGIEMSRKNKAGSKSKKKQQPPPTHQQVAPVALMYSTNPPSPTCTTAPQSPAEIQIKELFRENVAPLTRVMPIIGTPRRGMPTRSRALATIRNENTCEHNDSCFSDSEDDAAFKFETKKEAWMRQSDAKFMAQHASHTNGSVTRLTADDHEQVASRFEQIAAQSKTTEQCGSVEDDAMSNPSIFSHNGSRVSSGTSSSSYPTNTAPGIDGRVIPEPVPRDQGYLRQLYYLSSEMARLERELGQARSDCQKHHPTGGNVRQKLEVNSTLYGSWDEAVEDLSIQLDMFVKHNEELREENRESGGKFYELQMRSTSLEIKLQKLQTFEVKLQKAESQLMKAERLNADQDRKIQDSKSKLEMLAGQKSLLEKLEGKLVTSESQKANVNHKLQTSNAECGKLREQMKVTQQKWEQTNSELTTATESIAQLEREFRVVENERISLANQLKKSTAAQTLATTKLAQGAKKDPESIKEIESLKQKVRKLERKFGNREQEIMILEEDIVSANLQQAEAKQGREARDEKIQILEDELKTINVSRINGKQSDDSHTQEIKYLRAQLCTLRFDQEQFDKDQARETKLLRDQLIASERKCVELERCCGTRDTKIKFLGDRQSPGSHQDNNGSRENELSTEQLHAPESKGEDTKMLADLQLLVASQVEKIKYLDNQLLEAINSSKGSENALRSLELQLQTSEDKNKVLLQQFQQQSEAHRIFSVSLTKQLEQQWTLNITLRNQLDRISAGRQTQDQEQYYLREEIKDANYRCSELENQLAYLQKYNQQGMVERQATPGNDAGAMVLQSSQTGNEQLQQGHLLLQQGHLLLYEEHQTCGNTIQELKDQLSSLTRTHQKVLEDRSVAKKDQFKAAIHQTAYIQELRNKITQLEQVSDSKDSFVKCAIDVRLGYLEHARTLIETSISDATIPEEENREVHVNAKIATHCANGRLDADVLTHPLFPKEFSEKATKTFGDLYSIEPERYGEWGTKVATRLVDCQALLKTIPTNENLGLEREDLEEYYRTVQNLLVLRTEVGDVEFEESKEAEWLVGRLEYLTGMIVALRV